MKKNNGFTLIELLAVIIILAVIALIATPIVLNVVDNAKLKALDASANGVVDGARYVYMENLMAETPVDLTEEQDASTLKLQGEVPTEGKWSVNTASTNADEVGIKVTGLKFKSMPGYTCTNVEGNKIGKMVCSK